MKILGFVLIGLAIAMFAYKGFTFKTKEKVVDLGAVEINKEEKHSFPYSPVLGGIALVGGIFLVGFSGRRN